MRSEHFLELDDLELLQPLIAAWMFERIPATAFEALANVAEKRIEHLEGHLQRHEGREVSLRAELKALLRSRFDGIAVFHATRAQGIESFKSNGLRAWSPTELRSQAFETFGSDHPAESIAQAIQQCNPDHRGGHVYSFSSLTHALSLDLHGGSMPSFARHGGEFIHCVGMQLGSDSPHTSSRAGDPMLIKCHLRWASIDSTDEDDIVEHFLSLAIGDAMGDYADYVRHWPQCCLSVSRDISPAEIVAFGTFDDSTPEIGVTSDHILWQEA